MPSRRYLFMLFLRANSVKGESFKQKIATKNSGLKHLLQTYRIHVVVVVVVVEGLVSPPLLDTEVGWIHDLI